MAIVDPTPNLNAVYSDREKLANLIAVGRSAALQPLIERANDKYLYWSEIKYRIPAGVRVSPEEVWAYLKLVRSANRKPTPVTDKEGNAFTYWITDSLHREISYVDRWSGGLMTTDYPAGLPSKEQYIISSLMDEAIASSQLEGASTEYRVAKEMLRTGRKPENKHEQMIFNNWKAMQFIREHIGKPVSVDILCEIQSLLTQDTLDHPEEAGKLRERDDIVVNYRDEIVHEPPLAATLKSRMDKLCEVANQDEDERWIHPVIKGAMLHFWIGYDHPFTDGNGRTARALMYWYLLNRGYVLFQYLSISKHFIRAPGQYVRAYLCTEKDDNDLTYFLAYNLSAIRYALHELRRYLHRKQEEIINANQLLRSFPGLNNRQKALIYDALQHPGRGYTIEAHKNTHGVAYDTARRDLLDLAAKKFVHQMREGKKLLVFYATGRTLEKLKSGPARADATQQAR